MKNLFEIDDPLLIEALAFLPETVHTPVGEELVFPGWDKRPTLQMPQIDASLIDACREKQMRTLPSMQAVVPPSTKEKRSL